MFVDPDATLVGPESVTVGLLVLELWQEVQVEPFMPEKPEMPLLLACAATGKKVSATAINPINTAEWVFRGRNIRDATVFEALGPGL